VAGAPLQALIREIQPLRLEAATRIRDRQLPRGTIAIQRLPGVQVQIEARITQRRQEVRARTEAPPTLRQPAAHHRAHPVQAVAEAQVAAAVPAVVAGKGQRVSLKTEINRVPLRLLEDTKRYTTVPCSLMK
jgi:hypothetical protein